MASMLMLPPVGCSSCSVQGANFQCFTCGTYYCGVSCQINHWPTHKDFCIPRLVMATPLLGNSSILTQYPPPPITKPSNAILKREETEAPTAALPMITSNGMQATGAASSVASTGAVPKKTSNVVLKQEMLSDPVTNSVATTTMLSEAEDRKDNSPVASATNGAAMTKTLSDMQKPKDTISSLGSISSGEKPVTKTMINQLYALKASQPVKTVVNGEKSTNSVLKNPFLTLKASQSAETAANAEKLKTPLHVMKANKPVEGVTIEQYAPKSIPSRAPKLLQHGHFPEPGRNVKIAYVANDRLFIYDCGPGPNDTPNVFHSLIVRSLQCAIGIKDFLSTPPTIEDMVFAPFEDDFYRAVVKSLQDGIADVFFPDFGNSLKIEWKKLKDIPDPTIKYAKTVTHPVWIDNVKSFTPRMREFLVTLVDLHEFVLTTVIDMPNTHIKMVEMRNSREQYVLSEKLLAMQEPVASSNIQKKLASQLRPPNNVSKLVVTNPTTYKPVNITEMVEANIAEGKGVELMITHALHAFDENKLSVIAKSDYTVFEKMMKDCQMYGQIDPNPYKSQEQEICLVKVKDIWHRATPVELKDDEAVQFYLFDLPAFSDVEHNAPIRRYPPGLTRNLYAAECIVENPEFLLQAANGDESNKDMLPGMAIRADVHHLNDEEI
uniref:MYND-type domain-containing protein n=1 Tax=Anopheles christyi TaxID=43041 RepID=A0A182K0S1_9DIPT